MTTSGSKIVFSRFRLATINRAFLIGTFTFHRYWAATAFNDNPFQGPFVPTMELKAPARRRLDGKG